MKGSLENFKLEVHKTIKEAYRPYRNDFQNTIGYLPYENKKNQNQSLSHENDKLEEATLEVR